jgi:omega-6 fatty acid desaturase (delta-12 desaturase)
MFDKSDSVKTQVVRSDWYKQLGKYEKPHLGKAVWQLVNTLVPYAGLWTAIVWMLNRGYSFWLTLPLMVIAAGLLVRVFIFFHDCGHGSFFASPLANKIVGYICGILVFTPYEDWRHPHAVHHASTGDLERRGHGDIWTMTVEEYLAAPLKTRFAYRAYRNPFVMLFIGPLYIFLISQRVPHSDAGPRERESVYIANIAIAGIMLLAHFTIGLKMYAMVQIPIMSMAGAAGVWMFYVQHQFEPVYWARHDKWDPIAAALEGSSYYKLPKVLQWFTGNIGLHHIHHLRPRIPNYNLQQCYDEVAALQVKEPLTIKRSIKSMFMNLWDESHQRLISFRALKRYRMQRTVA